MITNECTVCDCQHWHTMWVLHHHQCLILVLWAWYVTCIKVPLWGGKWQLSHNIMTLDKGRTSLSSGTSFNVSVFWILQGLKYLCLYIYIYDLPLCNLPFANKCHSCMDDICKINWNLWWQYAIVFHTAVLISVNGYHIVCTSDKLLNIKAAYNQQQ